MNQLEIEQMAQEIATYEGARLQDVRVTDSSVALGFYLRQKYFWVFAEVRERTTWFLMLDEDDLGNPPPPPKPLTLFLRSHFESKLLSRVEVPPKLGRVVRIDFRTSDDDEKSVELRVFPQGFNCIAIAGSKKLSLLKPKDLSANASGVENMEARSFSQIKEEWLTSRKRALKDGSDRVQKLEQQIEKKTRALEKMREDLAQKRETPLRELGEWLKLHQTLEVPPQFEKLIDPKKSLSENITHTFKLAKDLDRKIQASEERLEVVLEEILRLKKEQQAPAKLPTAHPKKSVFGKGDTKGRTFEVAPDLKAFVGKSAKDNMEILRRAQPFDYWLHLRDQPSAHAIISRTRNRNVTDQEFQKAAHWLLKENFGRKAQDKVGETFDIVVCECRYVKAIKGDKLGRVYFSNERTLRVRF